MNFTFNGITGTVDAAGFVRWNGIGFQQEAAGPDLREAIERARFDAEVTQAREALVRELAGALVDEWETAHNLFCGNAKNCESFGGERPCQHPRPEVLAKVNLGS